MAVQIQVRRGDAALWTSSNPTLAEGEIGAELDTGRVKIGDGTTAWNSLGYSLYGVKNQRLVIGTSTAGWTSSDCDYLCDGTADDVEINAAITDLPATGGEIVILDGTYNITAKIDVTKDNISIRGNGNATILMRMFDSSVEEGVITLTSRSDCKIADLQVDGNQSSYTGGNNYGIYLTSSSDNTVTGNTVIGNYLGICLDSSTNNTVTGNTCNNSGDIGIYLSDSTNNTVTGNTCNNSSYNGIHLDNSTSNTVTDNTVNNSSNIGIYLTDSSNNTITNNTTPNNYLGICLDSSTNNTVTGNTCNNSGDAGIYLSDSSNNTITGNTANNNNYGIYFMSSSNNTVTGNTCIRGTGLPADYSTYQYTISIVGTGNSYNLISNNNCMGKAPVIGGGTGNTIIDNKWSDSSGRILENYTEKLTTLTGTSTTINLLLGNVFTHTLSGDTTYTISNAVSGQAHSFTLIINMGSTVRTLTFPASVKWQGGEMPDMSTEDKTYVLTFMSVDGGTNWLGMFGGEF